MFAISSSLKLIDQITSGASLIKGEAMQRW
jgi:hypothetical protein